MNYPISVELDEGAVESGGVLHGRVRFHAGDVPLEAATGLEVRAQCRISGSPWGEKINVGPSIRQGPFSAGHVMPFEIPLPETPVTWKIPPVTVAWVVHLQLIVEGHPDPVLEAPFELVPRKAKPAAVDVSQSA